MHGMKELNGMEIPGPKGIFASAALASVDWKCGALQKLWGNREQNEIRWSLGLAPGLFTLSWAVEVQAQKLEDTARTAAITMRGDGEQQAGNKALPTLYATTLRRRLALSRSRQRGSGVILS